MRFTLPFLLLLGCGGSVAPESPAAETTKPEPVAWTASKSCTEVRASCTGDGAVAVRGHAEGLVLLDGARVEFAVRYILEDGKGLDVPHGVALGRTHVKDGAFETCVCVPRGANMYPQIAAVVYEPHTTSISSKDVARATFSQRYATSGDEDVGYALKAVPNALQKEAAVAGMSARSASLTLKNLGPLEGQAITAGLIADERPVAADTSRSTVASASATLQWHMPGHAYASERIAFFVDRNLNGKCDDGDVGGVAPSSGIFDGALLSGGDLSPVCSALQIGARE